jgi:hypothetical protein
MPESTLLDREQLKQQDAPTEAQLDIIAKNAWGEKKDAKKLFGEETPPADKPVKKEEKPVTPAPEDKDEQIKKDEELLSAKDEDLSDEQKQAKGTLVKAKEEKETARILAADESTLNDEEKTKRIELVKAKEVKQKEDEEKKIQELAEKDNLTVEEARKVKEHIKSFRDKYKDDPEELAKANYFLQSHYHRVEEELKGIKEAKQEAALVPQDVPVEAIIAHIEQGKMQMNGAAASKDQVIAAYRKFEPDLTADLDDERVLILAAKEYKVNLDREVSKQKAELPAKAKDKRESLYTSLGEADKKFLPRVKEVVEKLADVHVLSSNFSLEPYILFAKGEQYDVAMKSFDKDKREHGEREFKRGQEQAKIIGQRTSIPADGKPPLNDNSSGNLTSDEKKRALEMYDTLPHLSETEKFKMYLDYKKRTSKK